MRLTINKNDLQRALSHVQNVIERKHSIHILSNVKISAQKGKLSQLTFAGTDMDITIVSSAPAVVTQEGELTAPAHMLAEIVRKLPDGAEVALSQKEADGKLDIQSDRAKFSLQTISSEEFPQVMDEDMDVRFSVKASDLKKLIERTQFAISNEETRYYLNGIYLHAEKGEDGSKIIAVATDGHRLAKCSVTAPEGSDNLNGIIIPKKAVAEVLKLLESGEEMIEVGVSDSKIRFEFGHTRLTTKLIDGKFPEYSRVIPKNNDKSLIAGNVEFGHAVDRVSTISSEKMRAVKISISKDNIHFSARSGDNGMAEEEIYAEYSNEPLTISFNFKYLLDITRQIDSGKMEVIMHDSSSPVIIRDATDDSALFVVMPLRI